MPMTMSDTVGNESGAPVLTQSDCREMPRTLCPGPALVDAIEDAGTSYSEETDIGVRFRTPCPGQTRVGGPPVVQTTRCGRTVKRPDKFEH
jgi:hypothetical protein